MDLREILKEAGVEDKAIKQILTTMKAEKIYTTSEENVDVRIKKYKEKLEKAESNLEEAVTKIDSYKDLESKNNTLTKEVETLKKSAADKEFNSILSTAREENDLLFEKTPGGVPDFSTGGKGSGGDPKEKSIGEKLAEAKRQTVEIKY